jgi:polyhydroxybutyrate depolymerase
VTQETGAICTALLTVLALLLASPAPAHDGPVRQWLKERRQQRQQPPPAGPLAPGDHRFTLQHDGLARAYRVHVPASYRADRPAALLVALHGGGGNMDFQADDSKYGLLSKSEREGFVVVFPNGYSKLASGKFATWNAGRCCGAARDAKVDDVGFIREVVARVSAQLDIDPQRVYATGMSNGGLMAYRLACEASDVFSAIAPVAGTDNTVSCTPARPVSVLHIHAKNDSHVLFEGGAGPDSVARHLVTDFTSVPDSVAKWAALNGCAATPPKRVLEKPGAYCEEHAPCRGGTRVQSCVTESGGHSWPGGTKARAAESPSTAISANDVMWEFFSRH